MSKTVRSIAYGMLKRRQGAEIPSCEICGVVQGEKPLCVDHDHVTGIMRGLLCSNCNAGLGMLGDTLDRARAALAYLQRHEDRSVVHG